LLINWTVATAILAPESWASKLPAVEAAAQLGAIITARYNHIQGKLQGFLVLSGGCTPWLNHIIGITPNQRPLNRTALLATIYRGLQLSNPID
jgi:hypothetical protein